MQLASMGRLADLARRARGVEKHRLRVGIAPSLAIPVLPGLAARLQAHFSELDMDVRDIASTEQTEALLANEIDIGMACLRPRHSAVSVACCQRRFKTDPLSGDGVGVNLTHPGPHCVNSSA
ncbi:LysR substrate-binding domain-containing protein [Eleftheria terrae]|uniref:LysR substrate-binding domain-containing protein n=1 Tax=Eleftheria terrae TaxID=1597781 RepID=UPI00263BE7AB|nr:LysR substrate-binding domain-containing protein [Eleftheria terrae]WKB56054.1 LysR substrate-binding domain-containing protein [Eleftheria terrae]